LRDQRTQKFRHVGDLGAGRLAKSIVKLATIPTSVTGRCK
jgi:hypothetical protein